MFWSYKKCKETNSPKTYQQKLRFQFYVFLKLAIENVTNFVELNTIDDTNNRLGMKCPNRLKTFLNDWKLLKMAEMSNEKENENE